MLCHHREKKQIKRAEMVSPELMTKFIDVTVDIEVVMLDDRKDKGQTISTGQRSATEIASIQR